MPKSFARVCSAPPPALGSHPLKQSPQQPSMWRLLGACCIPRLQAGRYVLRPKLAPLLCLPLRSKYQLHRLHGPNVYPSSSRRIRIVSKTYTLGGENVYVSSVKRIRLTRTRYTSSRRSFLPPRANAPLHRPQPYPSAEGLRRFVAEKAYLRGASQEGKCLSKKCPENGYEPSATYPHTGQGARGRLPA